MLDLNDPRWKTFKGGYQVLYDASVPLRALEKTNEQKEIRLILDEFWSELHHQGDVEIASYMALPHLIRIARNKKLTETDIPALVAVIEIQRHINSEPIPKEFEAEYEQEIKDIIEVLKLNLEKKWDREYATYAAAAIAAVNGQTELANVIMHMDDTDFAAKYEMLMENYDDFEGWLKEKRSKKAGIEANIANFDNQDTSILEPNTESKHWVHRIIRSLRRFLLRLKK